MGTWIIGAIVVFLIGFAVYSILEDRKSGKSCSFCPSGCQGCSKSLPHPSKKDD